MPSKTVTRLSFIVSRGSRILETIAVASGLLLSLSIASRAEPSLFKPGEKLHYRGYVLGWVPAGDAWFKIGTDTINGNKVYRFDARALGRYLVYTLEIRLTSLVDPATLKSLEFRRREIGTEKREYKVIFDREALTATYRRKPGRFKTIAEMDAAPWENRRIFPIRKDVNDILYTLYAARDIGDRIGAKKTYRFVENTDIWKTDVSVVGEKRLSLGKAGSFDALKIAIDPDYSHDRESGEKFRGLFGVEGSLEVWVEKRTRIPLIVRGQVPFAYIFKPTVTVMLLDYEL